MLSSSLPEQSPLTPSVETPRNPRNIQLDFLRGIAILLVIGHHGVYQGNAGHLGVFDRLWFHVGSVGVDLFFVLSGFLIGGLIFREIGQHQRLDVRRFLIRRAFRILPSYYLYIFAVIGSLMVLSHHTFGQAIHIVLPNLLNIQNYRQDSVLPHALPHTWSLAVEEHFYLILPLLIVGLFGRQNGKNLRLFPFFVLFIMVLALGLRLLGIHSSEPLRTMSWYEKHQWPTHLRMDSLLVGVLLAYFYHLAPARLTKIIRYPGVLAATGIIAVAIVLTKHLENPFVWTIGYTLLSLGFAAIILAAVSVQSPRVLSFFSSPLSRIIAFIGTYSYSIYLWHILLGQPLPYWFVQHQWLTAQPEIRYLVTIFLYVGVSTAVGVFFGKIIEFPAVALRDKLFPSLSGNAIQRDNRDEVRPGISKQSTASDPAIHRTS